MIGRIDESNNHRSFKFPAEMNANVTIEAKRMSRDKKIMWLSVIVAVMCITALAVVALNDLPQIGRSNESFLGEVGPPGENLSEEKRHKYVHPSTREYRHASVGPFSSIRWQDDTPVIRVLDYGGELVLDSLGSFSVQELIRMCKAYDNIHWRKLFNEDIAEVMRINGHPLGFVVTIKGRDVHTNREVTVPDVECNEATRNLLLRSEEIINGESTTSK